MAKQKPIGGLSPREVRLLEYLRTYIGAHAYAPSYAEICETLDFASKSGVARVMDQLEDGGLIKRVPGKKRAVQVTAAGMGVHIPGST